MFSTLIKNFGLEVSAEELIEDFRRNVWRNAYPFPDAVDVLKTLRSEGMRLGVVTNGSSNMQRMKLQFSQLMTFLDVAIVSEEKNEELLILNDALERLSAIDKRKTQVVELRYFGGLSVNETAEVLKISPNTVLRDWNFARAWLHREIKGE